MVDFSFLPFSPLQGIWVSPGYRLLSLQCLLFGISKWEISCLLIWMGAVDHPFCSASPTGGGCCQHPWAASTERPAAKGTWNHSWLQNQCQVGALPDFAHSAWTDLKAGKRHLITQVGFIPSSSMARWLTESIHICSCYLEELAM